MAILSKAQIKERIFTEDMSSRLCITPITDYERQISEGTIDIRIGTHFIIFKGRKIETVDPTEKIEERVREFQEKVYIPYGKKFIHPLRKLKKGKFMREKSPLIMSYKFKMQKILTSLQNT